MLKKVFLSEIFPSEVRSLCFFFTFFIKRRYVECIYETYNILKLQNSYVTRRDVLPGMVGKYYDEKK